ncbi:hypothetical protein I3760_03G228800 [Carya illinoinensis]|nr:hypothetical protein I3760_03G228800 [Carya illinoinensis]
MTTSPNPATSLSLSLSLSPFLSPRGKPKPSPLSITQFLAVASQLCRQWLSCTTTTSPSPRRQPLPPFSPAEAPNFPSPSHTPSPPWYSPHHIPNLPLGPP